MNARMHLPTNRSGRYRYARYQKRLTVAVTLSVLAHAFILSLRFGLPGIGLPGLELPWQQRRAQPVGLAVVLSPVPRAERAASDAESTPAAREPILPREQAIDPARAAPAQKAALPASAGMQLFPAATVTRKRTVASSKARASAEHGHGVPPASRPVRRRLPSPAASGPRLITQDDMGQDSFAVPLPVLDGPEQKAVPVPSALPELAQSDAPNEQAQPEPDERTAQEQEQMRAAQAQAEAEAVRREAEARAQQEQRAAQELEARRQAEALALQERERREAEENSRRALELEAQRQAQQRLQDEARRQAEEAARQAEQRRQEEESARLARERQEQQERQREELRLQEEARVRAREQEARRQEQEAALRRRQAEELAARERAEAEARRATEAAQARQREQALADKGREPADMTRSTPGGSLAGRALELARRADDAPLPPLSAPAADPARRRSVLGRVDHDVSLMMYVESWRLKIERNGRLNYRQSLAEGAYTEPIVTVAVRSDGSIEDIVFHRGSGRPELDEAVRRIVRLNARYAAFPPELARRFDVIEIRRVWNFDDKLRLLEEVR